MYLNICFEMLQREAKSAQSDIGTEQNNDKIPIHPSIQSSVCQMGCFPGIKYSLHKFFNTRVIHSELVDYI